MVKPWAKIGSDLTSNMSTTTGSRQNFIGKFVKLCGVSDCAVRQLKLPRRCGHLTRLVPWS